ncbi:MAG: extracellular solute-binding protein family 1 [Paenibacillus sp.]|jgi:multiple sugar transport system substrate-binding protein|nr:extracellular solute-binding protein family 1 [Paenibacillus sp.]
MKRSMAGPMLLAALLAGCSGNAGSGGDTGKDQSTELKTKAPVDNPIYSNKPIELTLSGNTDADDIWKRYIEDPIKKKFPNVTLVRAKTSLAELVAAGTPPDLIQFTPSGYPGLSDLGLQFDLRPLIKTYGFDTSRFIPELMDSVAAHGDSGQLYGIPLQSTLYGLLYNKDLFDKFAMPYPKGELTWDEAIALTRQMSRTESGIKYRGLEVHSPLLQYSQLSLNPITKDGKASVTSAKWQEAANMYKSIYSVPGNEEAATGGIANFYQPFFDGKLAMLAISTIRMITQAQSVPNLNWDVAPFPTFKDAPNSGPQMNYSVLGISPTSKYKDEAFAVIAHLVSDEAQKQFVRSGFITPLKSPEVQQLLGADIPSLKNKNVQVMYKQKQANYIFSKYQTSKVTNAINDAFTKVRKGETDVNSALREAEELINKEIEQVKQK